VETEEGEEDQSKECPFCGTSNEPQFSECRDCGRPLSLEQQSKKEDRQEVVERLEELEEKGVLEKLQKLDELG
jgi:hypothetical protein